MLIRDLRYAVRTLLQSKGWTSIVLLSLALGIGANTALFNAINGLLLQSVAVPDPDALVRLKWAGANDMVRSSSDYGSSQPAQGRPVRSTVSFDVFRNLRAANQTLVDLAASAPIGQFNVVIDGDAQLASSLAVSGNYFRMLQLTPAAGRLLVEDDDDAARPPVAVLSHAYWRARFAGEPAVVGRVVAINGQQVTIVGVTPASFFGTQRLGQAAPDVTVPLAFEAMFRASEPRLTQPTNWWVQLLGRAKPGISYEQIRGNLEGAFHETARAGMAAYMASLTTEERGLSRNQREGSAVPELLVSSGRRGTYDVDGNTSRSAAFLGVVSLVVLLIVCANVANLLVSRATSRHREISIRLSMGATRARLVRQLLTESLVLSCGGGAFGIVVAYWSRALLPFGQDVAMDWRVYGFAAGLSLLTGIVFGLLPALRTSDVDLAGAMKADSRSVAPARTFAARVLLVVQVAASLVLLVGAGLFLRTLHNLHRVDVGFNPDRLLMFGVNPQASGYEPDRAAAVFREIRERLKSVPGVTSAAVTRVSLLSGSTSTSSLHVPGQSDSTDVHMMSVSPEFFETMEIPLRGGRGFTERDTIDAPKVAVINESAARTLFPGVTAIGQRAGFSPEENAEFEIVGVIADTKYNSLRDAAPPTFYQSYQQSPIRGGLGVMVKTNGDPSAMVPAVRAAMREIDPTLPLAGVATQDEQIERRVAQERLFAMAYSLFGGLALLLAAIGLFGVMSYNVARRTGEIGIRMALGAQRGQVAAAVMRESLVLVGMGVVIGLTAAVAARRFVTTVLFGVEPLDPMAIGGAIVLIVVVSAIAAWLPARRAARIDPLIALQNAT